LRRAARLGDAWYPIGTNPAHPLDSLPRYRGGIARLHKAASEAGRDPMSIGLALRCARHGDGLPTKANDGERRLFSGGPADIANDLRNLRELGVTHVDFNFGGGTTEEALSAMQRFRHDVVEGL
jgi:alkanesulfonate monooxygenase SsuD/methylene tetrahydromethanopterin reductase-like flavin-dependent oxidoreductase (luciferase family)